MYTDTHFRGIFVHAGRIYASLVRGRSAGHRPADRLGRSLPHLLETVNRLKVKGIAFRSLTEQMNTNTPQGEFLFSVFGALAQFERSLTQDGSWQAWRRPSAVGAAVGDRSLSVPRKCWPSNPRLTAAPPRQLYAEPSVLNGARLSTP